GAPTTSTTTAAKAARVGVMVTGVNLCLMTHVRVTREGFSRTTPSSASMRCDTAVYAGATSRIVFPYWQLLDPSGGGGHYVARSEACASVVSGPRVKFRRRRARSRPLSSVPSRQDAPPIAEETSSVWRRRRSMWRVNVPNHLKVAVTRFARADADR